MATIRVRPYQGIQVYQLLTHLAQRQGCLLDGAVTTGKTVVSLTVATLLILSGQIRKGIFMVPKNDLKVNFTEHSGDVILPAQGASRIGTATSVTIPEIQTADTGRELLDLARDPNPGLIIASYPMIRLNYQDLLQIFANDLSQVLFVPDEGHRIGSTQTAEEYLRTTQVLMDARSHGAKTLQLSGTAYRGDGLTITLTDANGNPDPVVQRTLFQHNAEGYTPDLEAQVLPLQVEGRDVDGENGQVAIPLQEHTDLAAQNMCQHMLQSGCPISFVRVKADGTSEQNQETLERIRDVLIAGGINAITHATCSSTAENETYDRFVAAVKRRASYSEIRSIVNVIVVLQMFDEGVDLGAISHCYIWGIPQNMGTLQQIIGRILRARIDHDTRQSLYEGYPDPYLTHSKVVFVTSALGTSLARDTLMFRIAAWFYSYALGSFLRRRNDIVEWIRSVPPQDPARDAEMARRAALTAWAAEQACRAMADPASRIPPPDGSDPVEPLVNRILNSQEVQIPDGSSEAEARSILRRAIGRLIHITQPHIRMPDQDNYNDLEEQAITAERAQFVSIAQGQTVLDYVFRVRVQDPCFRLHRDVCLETTLDQALRFAAEFQAANDRLPGALGRPLNGERVPNRMTYFDRLSNVAWRESLVGRATEPRSAQVLRHRRAWIRAGINNRQTHTDYTHGLSVRNDPLMVYYPSVLWVYPYEWTDRLTLGDLASLGSWMASVARARIVTATDRVNQQVDQYVRTQSTDALVTHIRAGTLDQIRAVTVAAE